MAPKPHGQMHGRASKGKVGSNAQGGGGFGGFSWLYCSGLLYKSHGFASCKHLNPWLKNGCGQQTCNLSQVTRVQTAVAGLHQL